MPTSKRGGSDRRPSRIDPAGPATGATGLSYLHPDRLRPGCTGVFTGPWARATTGAGVDRYQVGYVGVLTATDPVRFECDRDVALTIVADHTALGTSARVGVPDHDGRHPIGGDGHWRAVDPASCERIVGCIPPEGEQQRFVTLVHTPDLRLPHHRLAVTALRELVTFNGVAFVADLAIDGRYGGRIENEGNGGATTYFGDSPTPFTWRQMDEFVSACRRHGQPVSEEYVLNSLVDEYDYGRQVADVTAAGATLVRLVDDNGLTADLQQAVPAPTTLAERTALAHLLAARPVPDPTVRFWQMWSGTGWEHLTDVGAPPAATAQPAQPADPVDPPVPAGPAASGDLAAPVDLAAGLVPGQRYRLRYRSSTQRLDRSAVMVYLDADGENLLFSARPAAGTQQIPRTWLLSVEAVPADTPVYLNRIER
jgi:hypothetical protein